MASRTVSIISFRLSAMLAGSAAAVAAPLSDLPGGRATSKSLVPANLSSCSATVSARCFTRVPSSASSPVIASLALRVFSAALSAILSPCPSSAAVRRLEFGDLSGEIAGAAGQVCDLAADVGAVAQSGGDGVVDREFGQHRDRDDHRFEAIQAGQQIKRAAGAGRDQHHAKDDKNGAKAQHRRFPRPRAMICPITLNVHEA